MIDRATAERRIHMNLTGVGGTAFTAYYTGIFSLQQSERAVVSARQGSFMFENGN